MRTRHQRQLAEQAGAAPSPPRALPSESRPKRIRITKANAADASSAQSQPASQLSSSTQIPASVRSCRASQRGRARGGRRGLQRKPTTQDDAGEASDASTQPDASAQSDTSAHADGNMGASTADTHGEIPISLSGSATHPVSAAYGSPQSPSLQAGLAANVDVSRSTGTAHPVRGNEALSPSLSATTPVSASGIIVQPSIPGSQPAQQKTSPSDTSLLFASTLSSPITLGTRPPQYGSVGDPPGIALVESPVSSTPPNRQSQTAGGLAPTTMHGANAAGFTRFGRSAGIETGLPYLNPHPNLSQKPGFARFMSQQRAPQTPFLPRPQVPQVRGLPEIRNKSYSLVHTMLDMYPPTTETNVWPRAEESIAMAVPTEYLPYHYRLAAKLNPEMHRSLSTDPIITNIHEESQLTDDLEVEITVHDLKRKRADDDDPELTNGASIASASQTSRRQTSGSTMRKHFAKLAAERRRAALEESRSQAKANESSGSNPSSHKRTETAIRRVPDMYDENGNLTLGRFMDVTVEVDQAGSQIGYPDSLSTSFIENQSPTDRNPYVDGEIPDADSQPVEGLYTESLQQAEVPQTPRSRGWGLTSFLPSVQSVSKFIHFSTSRRIPSTTGPPFIHDSIHDASPTAPIALDTNMPDASSTPRQHIQPQRAAQTEPRQDHPTDNHNVASTTRNATECLPKRRNAEKPKKQLLTKAQIKERDRLKKEKEELRAYKERLKQEEARITREKKEWEEQRARVESAQTPGTKRKRVPSPDVIPLPPGGGFGLHPDYFTYDSSEEEESEEEQDTPTKQRPVKRARLSSAIVHGTTDSTSALSYEGGHFAPLTQVHEEKISNVFRKHCSATSDNASQDESTHSAPAGGYAVPSPSDSDDDNANRGTQSPNGTPTRAPETKDSTASSQSLPPPTPNPSHASLPSEKVWEFADPLEKARQKALQHQPKFGSRLRESSRLSTSTAGSEAGNNIGEKATEAAIEEPVEGAAEEADHTPGVDTASKDSEYDPKRPALLPQLIPAAQERPKASSSGAQAANNAEVQPTTSTSTGPDAQTTPNPAPAAVLDEEVQITPFVSLLDIMTPNIRAGLPPEGLAWAAKIPSGEAARAKLAAEKAAQAAQRAAKAAQNEAPPTNSPTVTEPVKPTVPEAKNITKSNLPAFDSKNGIQWAFPIYRDAMSSKLQAHIDKTKGQKAREELNEDAFDWDFELFIQLRENQDEEEADEMARKYFWPTEFEDDEDIDSIVKFHLDMLFEHHFPEDSMDMEEFQMNFDDYNRGKGQAASS